MTNDEIREWVDSIIATDKSRGVPCNAAFDKEHVPTLVSLLAAKHGSPMTTHALAAGIGVADAAHGVFETLCALVRHPAVFYATARHDDDALDKGFFRRVFDTGTERELEWHLQPLEHRS